MDLKERMRRDLARMMDPCEFAQLVVISGVEAQGMFDEAYQGVNVGTGEVASAAPQVLCQTDALPAVQVGDEVTAAGRQWKVSGIQPDGTGLTTLILEKA